MANETAPPLPTMADPALNITTLCRALAPYNGGKAPNRSTVRRLIKQGLPVAGRLHKGQAWFLLSQVVRWWCSTSGPSGQDT